MGLLVLLAAPPAGAQSRLTARPAATTADTLPQGYSRIGEATAYRPPTAGTVPGLLLLFHGAGGRADRFITLFKDEADRRGLVLFSVQSSGPTWDNISEGAPAVGRPRAGRAGGDARRVDQALAALFARMPVDQRRIVVAGFSDGASYALGLGTQNDHLFTGIAALAPGMLRKSGARRTQRIAIAHSRDDRVLPFANARQIASQLRGLGYPILFTEFAGGHRIDRASLSAALDFAAGR